MNIYIKGISEMKNKQFIKKIILLMDFNDNNINNVLHNLLNHKKQYNFDFLEEYVLNEESISNVYQKFLLRYSLNYCFSKKIWGNLNIITPDDLIILKI